MMVMLDAAQMGQRKAAHEYLAQTLSFPEYYGKNLDALYDCLQEYGELEVQFVNTEFAQPYFEKVRRVFTDAARQNNHIHILDASEKA